MISIKNYLALSSLGVTRELFVFAAGLSPNGRYDA